MLRTQSITNFWIIITLIIVISAPMQGEADPIYAGTSSSGKSQLFTSKPKEGFEKAELPPIIREDTKKKAESTLKSCGNHGGIDCERGADTDGSVICFDGFKESLERYNFSCKEAKLSILKVEVEKKSHELIVFIRNLSSVAAQKVSISRKSSDGKVVRFSGPDKIAGFQSGEFRAAIQEGEVIDKIVSNDNILVQCLNCP